MNIMLIARRILSGTFLPNISGTPFFFMSLYEIASTFFQAFFAVFPLFLDLAEAGCTLNNWSHKVQSFRLFLLTGLLLQNMVDFDIPPVYTAYFSVRIFL